MNTIHTICIVDDDEEIRSLLSDYLRRNGFSTCTAGNAAEFLEMQRRVPCSLIVMDIMLPGMNGLELFRTLRAESTVPVIFLTALGDITDRIVGLELGADDYLSKPFEPRELLARIRTVLRRTEAAVRMDMNALLDSLVSDRQDMGQDVMLEGHCRQPWTVRPNSLRRCLSNLLDNALRYSARVRIRLLEKADVLQIDVLDDGPGIPPEMLEQVFEPFFRLDEARSPHTGGSGLGLSIARSMACRNGGELSLHNRPEGGLCARLCLYRSAMEAESL